MANYSNPNGFRPVSSPARTGLYEAAEAVKKGDVVVLKSGKLEVFDVTDAAHTQAIGVCAEDGGVGDSIQVYDDPATCFEGEVDGTFAIATHVGNTYEVSGASGAMKINLAGSTDAVATILEHYPLTGADEVGAAARVKCVFSGHVALGA